MSFSAALVLGLFVFLLIGLPLFMVAYTAYRARITRERQAVVRPYAGPDLVAELERINAKIAEEATAARRAAQGAREAVRHGVRG